MKKFLDVFLGFVLLVPSFTFAVGPVRTAQCIWAPTKYNCSDNEKQKARKWIIAVPVAVVIATLAAIGIYVGAQQVEKMKHVAQIQDTLKAEFESKKAELDQGRELLAKEKDPGTRSKLLENDRRLVNYLNVIRHHVGIGTNFEHYET